MLNINRKRDGHVHTHYCPHGSKDTFKQYIEVALEKGLEEVTFTEHMPMPSGFYDENFLKECAPSIEVIEQYFQEALYLKEKFRDKLKINIGLEVDYIDGYEEYTKTILNKYEGFLDDGILSVHFVKYKDKHYCIDFIDGFEELLKETGSLEIIYDLYFDTILKSINCDLGEAKPKRIGHMTLIRIFNQKYPTNYKNIEKINEIVLALKKNNYEVDINTAGFRKKLCLECYPYSEVLKILVENDIKIVLGSDAHVSNDIGYNFENM